MLSLAKSRRIRNALQFDFALQRLQGCNAETTDECRTKRTELTFWRATLSCVLARASLRSKLKEFGVASINHNASTCRANSDETQHPPSFPCRRNLTCDRPRARLGWRGLIQKNRALPVYWDARNLPLKIIVRRCSGFIMKTK